jgi:hypothetical protein
MNAVPEKQPLRLPRWGIDRKLALVIGGAVLLIVAGLIAIPLAAGRQPVLAPETTPQGTVERFYQALYRGDYSAAHGYFSADTQRRVAVGELQQSLQYEVQNSQARIGKVDVNDSSATVQVIITHFESGGLFGPNSWESENQLLLQREDDVWKIVSGFGFFPAKPDAGQQQ